MKFHLLLLSFLLGAGILTATERPNIVFVLFDDIGYGEPGCYNPDSLFNTPNLDKLATQGMRFTDAHAPASCCTPSRYGFLTGRYPSRIGKYDVLNTFSPPIIPTSRLTIASFLKEQGYDTACIGKWHLGLNWIGREKGGKDGDLKMGEKMIDGPVDLGFNTYYGFTHARNIGTIIDQDTVVAQVTEVENQPIMIEKAVSYIHEQADSTEPFFLYFPMCPPHKPHVPAPKYIGKGGMKGKGGNYADWIYQGDDMLGQIMTALEESGQAGNTLLITSGDNGASGKEYEPLREHKGSIYEGGTREPFIARWPGKIKAGAVNDTTVGIIDVFATCADIIDANIPDNAAEDSVSILDTLLGNEFTPPASITQAPHGELAIHDAPWKLIFHDGERRELYHLQVDLSETTDVLAQNPEVVGQLTAQMQTLIDNGRRSEGAPQENEVVIDLSIARKKKKSE